MTIDIRKVTILIGEQATGKSTIAKLLAACRYLSFITNFDYFEKSDDSAFSWGLIYWGLDDYVKSDTYIYYSSEHYTFEGKAFKTSYDPHVEKETNDRSYDIKITFKETSAAFNKLIDELRDLNGGEDQFSISETPISFFQNKVAAVIDNPIYLPVERGLQSLFSLGKSTIQNLSEALFEQLAKLDKITRQYKDETEIAPLDIYYKNDHGKGYVKKQNGEEYFDLSRGASGYQSTIPVVLAIKYYNQFKKKRKTFLIEEPELNLFPNAQKKLIEFLIENVNIHEHRVFLTTHSPYILTSLNNLIYSQVVSVVNEEETNKVIARSNQINPNDVSAYMLSVNGTCEDILDKEEHLILAERIDAISNILNEQFDKLLTIEYSSRK